MNTAYFLIAIILVVSLTVRFYVHHASSPTYYDRQKIQFTTTVLSEPRVFSNRQVIAANLPGSVRVSIITTRFPGFSYGQSIEVSGTLSKRVTSNKRIVNTVYYPNITPVKNQKNNLVLLPQDILAFISTIRQNMIAIFEKTLPPIPARLLLGIVFGIKSSIPNDFLDDLRTTGVLHVIAASGMNVSLLGGVLMLGFQKLFRRQVALTITILAIIFYVALAGFEASIVRAGIMGIIAFSAAILGRQYLAYYSLVLAGYGMLLISPSMLYDVGFQLSFAATLGLITIVPLFTTQQSAYSSSHQSIISGIVEFFREDFFTTLAAQIATLPILLLHFGSVSAWSILVNLLVLWTVPLLMVLGGFGAFLGLVVETLGQLVIFLCLPFLLYFQGIVELFGRFGGVIEIGTIPLSMLVGYYLILGAIIIRRNSKLKNTNSK